MALRRSNLLSGSAWKWDNACILRWLYNSLEQDSAFDWTVVNADSSVRGWLDLVHSVGNHDSEKESQS